MTPKQAAKALGCSVRHVHLLIRRGTLTANRVPTDNNQHGYIYTLTSTEVNRYKRLKHRGGRPRGSRNRKPS